MPAWASVSIIATTLPLLQQLSPPARRVTAFSAQGAVGTLAGFLGNLVGGYLPLVTLGLFVREAFMNAAFPVHTALSMQLVADEERAAFMMARGGLFQSDWAVSTGLSGQLQDALGLVAFDYLFAAMFVPYALSIGGTLLFFWRDRSVIEIDAGALERRKA